jgi:integrase
MRYAARDESEAQPDMDRAGPRSRSPQQSHRSLSGVPEIRSVRQPSCGAGCLALAEGIAITEVSRWLGHDSIEVTHQIYGHLVPSSFARARAALDAAYQKNRTQR